MNIFIIPSWYPNHQHPLAGVFVQEQARSLAELNEDIQVSVSVAGAGEYHLPLRRLGEAPGVIARYLRARPERRELLPNLTEYHAPLLHWSPRMGANLGAMIRAHEKHLQQVIANKGAVSCIHAHLAYPAGWVAMVLAEKYGIPYIITEHTGPFPVETRRFIVQGRLTKWLRDPLEKANAVIAVSPSLADRIASFGLNRPSVIPNLVDEREFTPSTLPERQPIVFLTMAAMVKTKGIEDLLKAVALLSKQGVQTHHIIVGDGPDLPRFRTLARSLGIDNRVQWYGAVSREKAASLYRQCHVFVLPSHHETFGIVYAEAIACGRPVIATRCGGAEFIVNEANGIFVDVGDAEGLAEAMRQMAEGTRTYDSEAIRQDFMARFSRPVIVGALRQLYEELSARV